MSCKFSFSQSLGCLRGTSVYHQQNFLGVWYGTPYSNFCGTGSTTATIYASNVKPLAGPQYCNIDLLGSGVLVNYSPINCSLDKYVIMLLLPNVLLGISRLINQG